MPSTETLMSRTHNISCVDFHLKDLEKFGNCLEEAVNAAFPKGLSRYKEVHVLLLSWEDDNLGVITEVLELRDVFWQVYLYDVEEWRIPSDHSYKALRKQISKFLDEFEDKDSLLIVYYGGHGFMNDDRQCIWSCTETPESATVQWSGLQNMLEHAESDVLILLDCCAAASSISGTGSGVTEVIAACGFETWAPGVGEHSFTRSLIDELRYWSRGHTLSVAMLHNKVLSRIKYWKPRFGITGEHEHRKTPIYIVLSNERKQRSIGLIPLQRHTDPAVGPSKASFQGSDFDSSKSSIEAQSIIDENPSDSSQSSIDQVWPDKDFHHPKVLISLSLEEDQWLHTNEWIEWMRSVPAFVKYANVDGIYKSGSTLIVLSIPVAVWDLLPKDPAIAFIGFISSSNLLRGSLPPLVASHESIKAEAEAPVYSNRSPKRRLLALTASDENDSSLPKRGPLRSDSETKRDEARVILNKTVDGYYRYGGQGYREVGALFLTWKDDGMQCRETEVDKLRQHFEEGLKFKTEYFEIPSGRWETTALNKKLVHFCYQYDNPKDLAIIYYGGHAYEGKETNTFKPAAKPENDGNGDPTTFLNYIQAYLRLAACDQLVILDCSYSAKAFGRQQIGKKKFELMTSAAHNVISPGPNLPQSFTRSLNDAMTRLLKDNPKGFSTSHLYSEVYHTIPPDKPYKPLLFNQARENFGSIWLRPQVPHNPPKSSEDGRYLKLTLRLNSNPDLQVMNELTSRFQYLPHVDQVRFEDLYAPRTQIADFMSLIIQAQKLRPLIRKIIARRRWRRWRRDLVLKNKDHLAKVPNSLRKLELRHDYQPDYDWSSAIQEDNHGGSESRDETKKSMTWPPSQDEPSSSLYNHLEDGNKVELPGPGTLVTTFTPRTVNTMKKEDIKSHAQTYPGDGKRQRSPLTDQDSKPGKRLRRVNI